MDSESYWKKKELAFKEKWQNAMTRSSIEWIDRSDFWSEFKERYKNFNREISKEVNFPMALEDIRARIKRPPVFTPLEEDFPGPVERWYGRINKNLFLLTFYYHTVHKNAVLVVLEDDQSVMEEVMDALSNWRDITIY